MMITLAQIPSPTLPTADPNQGQQMLPLRDIRLPVEPGFWPLAPGWWLLITVILVLIIWLAFKWYKHRIKKQRWLAINQQLSEIEYNYQQNKNQQLLLTQVSTLLRRFVKYQLKQNQATSLAGHKWIEYLNQFDSSQSFAAYEQALTQGVYQANCQYDAPGLITTTRRFMQQQVMKPTASQSLETETKQQEGKAHV